MHRYFHRLLLLLIALCSFGFGQVAYQLAPVAHQQFFDANGKPLAGGFVYTYSAGSTTPLATYKDNAGTANTNPIVLDAGGFATIYLGQNSYKFCVQNSSAVPQWCQDNVQNISQVLLTTANTWTLGQTFNSLISFLGGTSDTTAADGNFFYRTDLHRGRWYDSGAAAWHSIVGADSTDTLTNKTLTSPTISNPTLSGVISGTISTAQQVTSTLATGTAPFVIASMTPVANLTVTNHPQMYNSAGTLLINSKEIIGTQALTAGAATVTFGGSFTFTNGSSFECFATEQTTAANGVKIVNVSATQFTITGTGTDVIAWDCKGN